MMGQNQTSEYIYVVSGTYAEYRNYVRRKINSGDIRYYVWVKDVITLFGVDNIKGVFIGSYKDRLDINIIVTRINTIRNRNNKLPIIFNSLVDDIINDKANEVIKSIMTDSWDSIIKESKHIVTLQEKG